MRAFAGSALLLCLLLPPTAGLRLLNAPPPNCTRPGLRCEAKRKSCFDKERVKFHKMTPTGPWALAVEASVRRDESGALVPVVAITWRTQTDGSIKYLKGTEVHVLKVSSNFHLCVLYKFLDRIDASRKLNEWWSFSLDQVVVEPEEMYLVSVSNLPKPNIGYDSYSVATNITVPGCEDLTMRWTKVCVESGSLWEPSANLSKAVGAHGRKTVAVNFYGGQHTKHYRVFLWCHSFGDHQNIAQENATVLRAVFGSLPEACCVLDVEIQPFFVRCKNYCLRHRKTFHTCFENDVQVPSVESVAPTDHKASAAAAAAAVLVLVLALFCVALRALLGHRRHKDASDGATTPKGSSDARSDAQGSREAPEGPRKVLVIYSPDHPLYEDIVLKLCAFLRARCGTEAVLDLLDAAELASVGPSRWLEVQKERLEASSGKMLILCSRGLRAKWRAMCDGHRLTLREDARSPTGDVLGAAFSVIVPDLLRPASFGKYVVAYFGAVCCEEDVPSPFGISVKYKLMNHFEEVYLRILDKEKLEPWQMNRVEGVAESEYHRCPSGGALRDAIAAFRAYQLENPDWFDRECVSDVQELSLRHPLLEGAYDAGAFPSVPEGLRLNAAAGDGDERCPLHRALPSAQHATSVGGRSSAARDRPRRPERSREEPSPGAPPRRPRAIGPSPATVDEPSRAPPNVQESERKGPRSGSDQGYASRTSCSL